jgi:hypothetical protein
VSEQRTESRDQKRVLIRGLRGACLKIAALILCLLAFAPADLVAQNGAEPIPFSAYIERLSAAARALGSGAELADVQQELAAIEEILLPNGEILSIEPLLEDAPDREAALARLHTLLAQLEASARDRTGERLAQLERVIEQLALGQPTFWERILRWIEEFIRALLPEQLPRGAETAAEVGSSLLVWTITILGVILLAVLLSYWFRGLLGGILRDVVVRRQSSDLLPETAAEARQQAHSLAQEGNYRQAVRQLYLSALLHLDEQRLLRFERDQTNREVLAQVAPNTPVRSHLAPVMATFDRVWYGIREPDQETFDDYRQEIDMLMAQTGERDRV